MKMGSDVMFEIIDIVREGLSEEKDISQMLRDIELEQVEGEAHLSEKYVKETRPNRGWLQNADVRVRVPEV